MNKIILMGRLTKDPEVRYSQSANPISIARFSIAVDKRKARTDGTTADFFSIVAFGRLSEFAEKYLRRGTKILLTGSVNIGHYDKNGISMPFFEVNAEDIEFAESKKASEAYNTGVAAGSAVPVTEAAAVKNYAVTQADDGFINVSDEIIEDLPFN